MSWYFAVIGKPAAVIAKVDEFFAPGHLNFHEPEQSVVFGVGNTIKHAVLHLPVNLPVKIVANGSQSKDETGAANSVSLVIEPLWGFVE